jgi:hypothetical protein
MKPRHRAGFFMHTECLKVAGSSRSSRISQRQLFMLEDLISGYLCNVLENSPYFSRGHQVESSICVHDGEPPSEKPV